MAVKKTKPAASRKKRVTAKKSTTLPPAISLDVSEASDMAALLRRNLLAVQAVPVGYDINAKAARPTPRPAKPRFPLSDEQQEFMRLAMDPGKYNILVEACIGSGKTTAIQRLCEAFAGTKKVLYLTYNKLLKLDAKAKIHSCKGVTVMNYHGFCYMGLCRIGVKSGVSDILKTYIEHAPPVNPYDVLLIDEYQDLDTEISKVLLHIKAANPGIQVIAVGDMCQKIYDRTKLHAQEFIIKLMDGNYIPMEFTKCFRISEKLAASLGRVWNKNIVGVNDDCIVEAMDFQDAVELAGSYEPHDLLILGSNAGRRADMQNLLEKRWPEKFNKHTVWSKISDSDGGATEPDASCAIFTTYDGCKGMERDVCFVFDFNYRYWELRLEKASSSPEIIRNIFCVAASRGKRKIVFVKNSESPLLTEAALRRGYYSQVLSERFNISSMFDFKFEEDVEHAYKSLHVRELEPAGEIIQTRVADGLIDLSPCVGIYQEANYFRDYDIDEVIEKTFQQTPELNYLKKDYKNWPMNSKVLYLTMLETRQQRYYSQVSGELVDDDTWQRIAGRLSSKLPADAMVQLPCGLDGRYMGRNYVIQGACDAVFDSMIWELKFVSELQHVHFLQLAMYLYCMDIECGRLWNVKSGQLYEVMIPDRGEFFSRALRAAFKL